MSRARNIKPGFYKNEDLAECSVWARLLFPGLWMLADREGRLENRPKRIKGEIFPYDSIDVSQLLDELEEWKFIERYSINGKNVISIINFLEHQTPHGKEQDSDLPDKDGFYVIHERGDKGLVTGVKKLVTSTSTVQDSGKNSASTVQDSGKNTLNPDILNPESPFLNPESPFLNPESPFLNPESDAAASCAYALNGESPKQREHEENRRPDIEQQPTTPPKRRTSENSTTTALKILADFGIDGQLAEDFVTHRKACGKKPGGAPITVTVMQGYQREAEKAGIPIAQAVKISIERNWQGFNSGWNWQGDNVTTPRMSRTSQPMQRPVYDKPVRHGNAIDSTCVVVER